MGCGIANVSGFGALYVGTAQADLGRQFFAVMQALWAKLRESADRRDSLLTTYGHTYPGLDDERMALNQRWAYALQILGRGIYNPDGMSWLKLTTSAVNASRPISLPGGKAETYWYQSAATKDVADVLTRVKLVPDLWPYDWQDSDAPADMRRALNLYLHYVQPVLLMSTWSAAHQPHPWVWVSARGGEYDGALAGLVAGFTPGDRTWIAEQGALLNLGFPATGGIKKSVDAGGIKRTVGRDRLTTSTGRDTAQTRVAAVRDAAPTVTAADQARLACEARAATGEPVAWSKTPVGGWGCWATTLPGVVPEEQGVPIWAWVGGGAVALVLAALLLRGKRG